MLKWSGSIGVGVGCDAGGGVGNEAADAFFNGVGDIQLSKKTQGAHATGVCCYS